MGHERVGNLPKSQKWRDIVQQIAGLNSSSKSDLGSEAIEAGDLGSQNFEGDVLKSEVSEIAARTIGNLRAQLRNFQYNESIKSAFKFLVCFSVASRDENPNQKLFEFGIEVSANPSPLAFSRAIRDWMEDVGDDSLEYREISQSAAVDAIATWFYENRSDSNQLQLFGGLVDPFEAWRKAGDGSGFCELSRLFFAKFTERYLNYFLEREASSALSDINSRNLFSKQLENHIDSISLHAFETAKITQSFAAGWYNNNAKSQIPSDQSIEGFLGVALGKIRDELLREGQ